jgi:hypothetical protein
MVERQIVQEGEDLSEPKYEEEDEPLGSEEETEVASLRETDRYGSSRQGDQGIRY